MFAIAAARARAKPEAEKPFWISYADLMTAMMTLFLAAMAVTLVAITQKIEEKENAAEQRLGEIERLCRSIEREVGEDPYIHINCQNNRIDFGSAGGFAHNQFRLPAKADQALARLVPVILHAANSELGRKWLKQVVIEGHTDTDGSYLYNLHLSLQRSEWVMCMLLDPQKNAALGLSHDQLAQVQRLFLTGGVSFQNPKESKDASRRVEFRLDFWPLNEPKTQPAFDFDTERDDRCMLP